MHDPRLLEWTEKASRSGFGRFWILHRNDVDAAFESPLIPPSQLRPDYTRALLLASPGRILWEELLKASAAPLDPAKDPLDRFVENRVESLATELRIYDPGIVTAYPFQHDRQLLGFPRLTAGHPWSAVTPLGLLVDPKFGPWFAWRALLLIRLDLEPTPLPDPSPCAVCIDESGGHTSPCIDACPAGAVRLKGFDWEVCAAHRLKDPGCEHTCPARSACPLGTTHRYSPPQMRHHYAASLREIRRHIPKR